MELFSSIGSNISLFNMISAARSATIIVGALIFPLGIVGKIEASTTRNLLIPITDVFSSTTASSSVPILQLHEG